MLDILSETGKLGVKSCNSPMASGVHLLEKAKHLRILRDIED